MNEREECRKDVIAVDEIFGHEVKSRMTVIILMERYLKLMCSESI